MLKHPDKVIKNRFICSEHFRYRDILMFGEGRTRLRTHTVPIPLPASVHSREQCATTKSASSSQTRIDNSVEHAAAVAGALQPVNWCSICKSNALIAIDLQSTSTPSEAADEARRLIAQHYEVQV